MFTDIDLSTEIMKLYTANNPSSLSVNILSQGNWPTYPACNPRIPESMIKSLEKFKGFYVGKHSGRTLKWQHNLDQLSLKANFGKGGKKELAVSLFQGLVLLLFNEVAEGGKLSYKEILEATRLGEQHFSLL